MLLKSWYFIQVCLPRIAVWQRTCLRSRWDYSGSDRVWRGYSKARALPDILRAITRQENRARYGANNSKAGATYYQQAGQRIFSLEVLLLTRAVDDTAIFPYLSSSRLFSCMLHPLEFSRCKSCLLSAGQQTNRCPRVGVCGRIIEG